MILTKNDILEAIRKGEIKIEPFDESALEAGAYNVSLDKEIRIFKEGINAIDVKDVLDSFNIDKITKVVAFLS